MRSKETPQVVELLLIFSVAAGCSVAAELHDRESLADAVAPLRSELKMIQAEMGALRQDASRHPDHLADAEVFLKGVVWALDFGPIEGPQDAELVANGLKRARQRIESLKTGQQPWAEKRGRIIRGFVSNVDGSIQPYGVIVPAGYSTERPIRLDVVLHGSSKVSGLSELKFINSFDEMNRSGDVRNGDYIELHPLGRLGENAYRFEGETDVFEAIETVCRNYSVDRSRIVLRGSSLGGVGTWQIGLKHPDKFAALGPTAGPVDTIEFAKSPWKHFVPLEPLTSWQQKLLHLVDAIDYTANGAMVPVVAAMGNQDPYYASHLLIETAFAREGIPFVGLVDQGAGHSIRRAVQRQQLELLGEHAAKGKEALPKHIRFVTWTLKYNRCHWIELLGLQKHYERAEIEARIEEDGSLKIAEPRNITRFRINLPDRNVREIRIAGKRLQSSDFHPAAGTLIEFRNGSWQFAAPQSKPSGKRPGLQGPIDDAFSTRFLCVRGTGKPLNPGVASWSDAVLDRFAEEWRRHYRGDLPIKRDTEVTEADVRSSNLILFGDPGSNRWIAEILPKTPVRWTREEVSVGDQTYSSVEHGIQLICPNPLPGAEKRYVVFNSGHTYHASELRFSYMVFPRVGDWAVVKIETNGPENSTAQKVAEKMVISGFFDENWAPALISNSEKGTYRQ
jgi:pimeloyl-ACP methyl ester carboxylesterase